MATILSIPTSVTILAPGSSVLSTVVASMAPGSWAQLSPGNQSAVLGVGSVTGSMVPYTNAMPWNRHNRSIEILAQDHNFGGMRHARYVEASNSFVLVADDVFSVTSGLGHGYDHTEVNPFNGDIYHKRFGGLGTVPMTAYRQPFGSTAMNAIATVNADANIMYGTCWWSGSFTGGGGLGAQGGFLIYTRSTTGSAADGTICIYDPVSNTWPFQRSGMSPFLGATATYNHVAAYSAPKNVAVYGGGHASPRKLWRLDSNGTVTAMPDTPSPSATIGIHYGTLVDDPLTGNFLLMSHGQMYELNPSGSGAWTQQTGSRVPPSGVGILKEGGGGNDFLFGVALPDHGVVAFIKQTNSGNGAFWLYKHA